MPWANPKSFVIVIAGFLIITACSSTTEKKENNDRARKQNQVAEYIYRNHDEYLFKVNPPEIVKPAPYPWEVGLNDRYPKITKEFFRCKGSNLNPVRLDQAKAGGEAMRYSDCGGSTKHSLPLQNKKEYIYPVLIDLLNHIQNKTGNRVVITSGHRCPDHNTYVDSSTSNRYSKHMIGAEVSFYVQGMENTPGSIIKTIIDFYAENPQYAGLKEYTEFHRYEKNDSDVSTPPWFNKEVFVKIYTKKEGRDIDNRHPYPYISLQVRYDKENEEKVTYSWEQANHNYMRW